MIKLTCLLLENALFQKVTGSVKIYWIPFSTEIADQEKIPKKYLETILRLPRNFNLLESKRVKYSVLSIIERSE